MEKKLTAYDLKLIAIIAMFLDHFAHIVAHIPMNLELQNILLIIMNSIGRITMPIMCFFIAEGYHHTHNLKKYFLRLFIFAAVSQLPYYIFKITEIPQSFKSFVGANVYGMNVICTLFMGLLALTLVKKTNIPLILRIAGAILIVRLTAHSDWRYFGVLWILVFGIFRGNLKMQITGFALISIIRCYMWFCNDVSSFFVQLCTLLAIPFLCLYNGERGKKSKYGFYIFYPAHLLILGIIRFLMLI